jgi:hypothetical protein
MTGQHHAGVQERDLITLDSLNHASTLREIENLRCLPMPEVLLDQGGQTRPFPVDRKNFRAAGVIYIERALGPLGGEFAEPVDVS